jgi:molecular chaperone GrpE
VTEERPPAEAADAQDGDATVALEPSPDEHDPERAETDDRLRRALADLDNLRKRYAREIARERAAERARVAAQWLSVVDDLERALQHAGGDAEAVIGGVRAVRDEALRVLERLGFPRFDDVGHPFDPTRHEAVGTIAADADPGTVVAAVRPGYGTPDAILRPAGVVVAAGSG